jgi:hypothetical protein
VRPRYESEEDRKRENHAREQLESRTGASIIKLNENSFVIDWAAFGPDDVLLWWGEYKWRDVDVTTYPDIILSAAKYVAGANLNLWTHAPFYFFVQFSSGLYHVKAAPAPYHSLTTTKSGRVDRNDPSDIEPCVRFPIEFFKRTRETLEELT